MKLFVRSRSTCTPYSRKISRLWYHVFLIYGLKIDASDVFYEKSKQKKVWGAVMLLFLQLSTCLIFCIPAIYFTTLNPVLDNISTVVFLLVNLCLAMCTTLVFYVRQDKFSLLLSKLINFASRSTNMRKVWNKSRLSILICLLPFIASETCEIMLGAEKVIQMTQAFTDITLTNATLNQTEITSQNSYYALYGGLLILNIVWAYCTPCFIMMSIFVIVHMCHMIVFNFCILEQLTDKVLKSKTCVSFKNVKRLQMKHEELCERINELSQIISPLSAFWATFGIADICFVSRAAKSVFNSNKKLRFYAWIFYLIKHLVLIFVWYKSAADVHVKAQQSALKIALIDCDKMKSEFEESDDNDISQIHFVELVTARNIGIQISGLFVVTYGCLLSMASIVLTYVIILYQTS